MYVVATRRTGMGRVARTHRLGDINWGSVLQTGIQTAGQVATVAEAPTGAALAPAGYSLIPTPTAASAIPAVGAIDPTMILLLGGLALGAVLLLSRR